MGIVGAILGDIAGHKYEFQWDSVSLRNRRYVDAARKKAGKDCRYDLFPYEADISDDTILSIATMVACNTDKDFAKWYQYFGQKYSWAGYGSLFVKWMWDEDPKPYGSYGNGSAMRVSYIGEKYFGDIEEVKKYAAMSAEVTHNHEEGIKGAVVTAVCIAMAKNGCSKKEILKYAVSEYNSKNYKYGCDIPVKKYRDQMKMDATCQNSVPVAIRCFYETSSFSECMYLINEMACDTDTIGAIAGSICESYYGSCLGSKGADLAVVKKFCPESVWDIFEKYY